MKSARKINLSEIFYSMCPDGEHLKLMTCLEINVPKVSKETALNNPIFLIDNQLSTFSVTKHYDIPLVYEQLRTNYERECGDLIINGRPDFVYLFSFSLFGKHFSKTDFFRYVGFCTISNDVIEVIWLHPYLRSKFKFMFNFFVHYVTEIAPIIVTPPVSEPFQKCIKKVMFEVLNNGNVELESKALNTSKKFLKKKSPSSSSDIDLLTTEEVIRIFDSFSVFSALTEKEIENSQVDMIIKTMIYTMKECKNNPSLAQEIANSINIDQDDILNKYKSFIKFGKLPKGFINE